MKTQLQDYHKTLIENSFEPIIVRNPEGLILEWNNGASELYGYKRDEAEGQNIHVLLKTVFPVSRKDLDKQLMQNGLWQGELIHTISIGNKLTVDSHQQYFVQADGTKLVLEVNRLNPSRARLHFLFNTMQEGMSHCRMLYDDQDNPVDWVYLEANPALERMHGIPSLRNKRASELFPNLIERNPEIPALFGRVARTGKAERFEGYVDALGKWLRIQVSSPERDEIFIVGDDITERKDTETALRKEKIFAESLIETAQAIVLVLDTEGRIVSFNSYMEELSGYRIEEVKGKDWFTTFLPGHNQNQTHEIFKRAIHEQRTQGNINPILTKDGHERLINWYDKTLKDENNQVIGLLAIGHDITELMQAEEVLQKSETKYRSLFESMAEQVMYWKLIRDDKGDIRTWRLVEINPAALKSWGKTREETIGRTADEIFPNATEHFMPIVKKLFREGTTYAWETYFPDLGQHLKMTSVPIGDYFIVTGSDITHLMQMQRRLQLSEERFRGFFENVAIGASLLNSEGYFVRVNDRYCAITGYSRNELLGGMQPLDLSHPDEREKDKEHLEQFYKGEVSDFEVEKRYLRKDGKIVWVHVSAATVYDDDGKILYRAGVIEDITKRKLAEAALRKSKARFQKIYDESPTGIAIKDLHGRVEQCNPAYSSMLGYSEEELKHLMFSDIIHPDDRRQNMEEMRDLLEGRIDYFEAENRYIHKNGKPVWVHKFTSLLPDSEEESVHIIVMSTDISQRKEEEQILELHGDEMARLYRIGTVNELASGLAHELSQPLTAIQNYAGGSLKILETGKSIDSIKPALQAINDQSQRLVDIIQHLRHMMQTGIPQRKYTDINVIARSARELLHIPLSRKHIKVDIQAEANLPQLYVDALQIEQVIIILIRNCIDAFTAGYMIRPIIQIRLYSLNEQVFIEVTDNGPGVTPDQLDQFFQPFHTTKLRGTGLGLMLARRLITAHQGQIRPLLPDSGGLTVQIILPINGQ